MRQDKNSNFSKKKIDW